MTLSTKRLFLVAPLILASVLLLTLKLQASPTQVKAASPTRLDHMIEQHAKLMLEEGRTTFRHDTFGSEDFWGGALQLHETIAGEKYGGEGPGLTPRGALSLGLKVDLEALPPNLVQELRRGEVDLDDPGVTLALLRLDSVVGVTGIFDGEESLQSIGIQCALCHSTVNDGLLPGIGQRRDGWANRDLDVGAIIAFAPNLMPLATLLGVDEDTVREVLLSWGPGKFDAELVLDGKAMRPDGKPAATLIPPAFGLAGVNLHTWTGWGSVTHWNAFVSNLEMHGKGTFYDPRLNDADQFPIAAREGFGNVRSDPDVITPKLAALHFYQLAIPAPRPPMGSFDHAAATRGGALFRGKAECATCHVEPIFTEPGWNMHTPEEIGIDDFQANRSPDRRYRTAPLGGLWTHTKGGFYHDGRFATLADVVHHYDEVFGLGLTEDETEDLVEYLKSIPDAGEMSELGGSPNLESGSIASPAIGQLSFATPNPSHENVTIRFSLTHQAPIVLQVFDVTGRQVRTLAEESRAAGEHVIEWDLRNVRGTSVASGVYFFRLLVDGRTAGEQRIVVP